MRSEWGPNWQGRVNRQLAKECLHKRTNGETALETRSSLFTAGPPNSKREVEGDDGKKARGWTRARWRRGRRSRNNRAEWSGNGQTERQRGKGKVITGDYLLLMEAELQDKEADLRRTIAEQSIRPGGCPDRCRRAAARGAVRPGVALM